MLPDWGSGGLWLLAAKIPPKNSCCFLLVHYSILPQPRNAFHYPVTQRCSFPSFFSPLHLLLPYSNNRFLFLHLPTCLAASTTTFISMLSLSSISLFEFGDLYFSGFPMSHPFITAIFICLSFNTAAVIGIRSVLPAACAAWNIKKTAAVCSWYCVIISRGSALAHRMVTDGALILLACAGLDEQLLALNASDDLQPQESVNTNLYLCISVLLSDNPTCKFSSVQWTSKISPKKIKKVN